MEQVKGFIPLQKGEDLPHSSHEVVQEFGTGYLEQLFLRRHAIFHKKRGRRTFPDYITN
jgi:hypothetical protein